MQKFKHSILATAMILTVSASSFAQEAGDMQACLALDDTASRLACFEQIAAQAE